MTPTQGINWLARLPRATHRPVAYTLGGILHYSRKKVAFKGLVRALPRLSFKDQNKIALQAARNQVAALLDWPNIHKQEFAAVGFDNIANDAKHQGGVILSLHLGMADAGTWYLNQQQLPTLTLVGAGTKGKRQETQWVSALLDKINVPYIARDAASTIKAVKAINQGQWLMMHCDMNGIGEAAKFFDHPTQIPSLGLHLTQMLKCPVYFHYGWQAQGCNHLVFEKFDTQGKSISEQAQHLCHKMEQSIRAKPEHWIWHYNRWK